MYKNIPAKNITKQAFTFAAVCLVVVLLMQGASYLASAKNASGEILGVATSAYSDLNNAGKSLSEQNFSSAKTLFESAQSNVNIAQSKLDNYKALTWLAPQANSADHILTGAGYLAKAGEKLSEALGLFNELKVSSKGIETDNFDQRLSDSRNVLIETRDLVAKSSEEFDRVNSIPLDYAGTLQTAKDQVAQLKLVLDKLVGLETLYSGIFGGQKTYFVIFQNYDEQRATGGFIGTYGVLKTNSGKITKLEIDSIYDLDGRITELVAAPGPFQPDIKRWGIRDANWFADFPTSASKLLYFFEKGYGTADGVISFTPKVFEDLLTFVGPIEMEEYGVTLTAENFQEIVQYKTSVDYDRVENEPKKLLADFAPKLLDKLTNLPQEQWLGFLEIVQNNLNQRHTLLYSRNAEVQKSIDELGFSGKILQTDFDYLNIINTNLGGTKTDLEVEQEASLKSKILSDGSILNTLTITRKNPTGQNTKDYIRIMVPLDSEFVSAQGFDNLPLNSSSAEGMRTDPDLALWDQGKNNSNIFVRTEAGKTEFAGWFNVEAEQQETVTVSYMLPFKINANSLTEVQPYSLLLQKQAGSKPFKFEGSISLGGYSAKWASNGVTQRINSVSFSSSTNVDDFWALVITK